MCPLNTPNNIGEIEEAAKQTECECCGLKRNALWPTLHKLKTLIAENGLADFVEKLLKKE